MARGATPTLCLHLLSAGRYRPPTSHLRLTRALLRFCNYGSYTTLGGLPRKARLPPPPDQRRSQQLLPSRFRDTLCACGKRRRLRYQSLTRFLRTARGLGSPGSVSSSPARMFLSASAAARWTRGASSSSVSTSAGTASLASGPITPNISAARLRRKLLLALRRALRAGTTSFFPWRMSTSANERPWLRCPKRWSWLCGYSWRLSPHTRHGTRRRSSRKPRRHPPCPLRSCVDCTAWVNALRGQSSTSFGTSGKEGRHAQGLLTHQASDSGGAGPHSGNGAGGAEPSTNR